MDNIYQLIVFFPRSASSTASNQDVNEELAVLLRIRTYVYICICISHWLGLWSLNLNFFSNTFMQYRVQDFLMKYLVAPWQCMCFPFCINVCSIPSYACQVKVESLTVIEREMKRGSFAFLSILLSEYFYLDLITYLNYHAGMYSISCSPLLLTSTPNLTYSN